MEVRGGSGGVMMVEREVGRRFGDTRDDGGKGVWC